MLEQVRPDLDQTTSSAQNQIQPSQVATSRATSPLVRPVQSKAVSNRSIPPRRAAEPLRLGMAPSNKSFGEMDTVWNDQHYYVVLRTLHQTMKSAIRCGRSMWDFAVELNEFTNVGVSKHLLRVMVCDGVIEHRREITLSGQTKRMFAPEKDVVLTERSCFVLSNRGRAILSPPPQPHEESSMDTFTFTTPTHGHNELIPIWDTQRRELRIGNVVIKRFKWPASNQEQVLRAFQEEGWPSQIDDPLPPDPKICPKRRLHDTIKCLNRRRVNSAIKFRGDGTGQGVILEIRRDQLEPETN